MQGTKCILPHLEQEAEEHWRRPGAQHERRKGEAHARKEGGELERGARAGHAEVRHPPEAEEPEKQREPGKKEGGH